MNEKKYHIMSVEKYEEIADEKLKKAGIGCLVSGSLITLLHYGDIRFGINNLYDFVQSIASSIFVGATLLSFVATFKSFLNISKMQIDYERLINDFKLEKLNRKEKRQFAVMKIYKYNEKIQERKRLALKTGALAVGLIAINNVIGYPLADSLDYNSMEIAFVQLGTTLINTLGVGAIGAAFTSLAEMVNFSKEQLYLKNVFYNRGRENENRITR